MTTNPTIFSASNPKSIDSWTIREFQSGEEEPLLTIHSDGTVVWGKPEKADLAADTLIEHIHISLERKAGIRNRRDEWENSIKEALMKISNNTTLTPELIDEVFKKAKMLSRLEGKE